MGLGSFCVSPGCTGRGPPPVTTSNPYEAGRCQFSGAAQTSCRAFIRTIAGTALVSALEAPDGIYNVTDDEPVRPRERVAPSHTNWSPFTNAGSRPLSVD